MRRVCSRGAQGSNCAFASASARLWGCGLISPGAGRRVVSQERCASAAAQMLSVQREEVHRSRGAWRSVDLPGGGGMSGTCRRVQVCACLSMPDMMCGVWSQRGYERPLIRPEVRTVQRQSEALGRSEPGLGARRPRAAPRFLVRRAWACGGSLRLD